VHDVGQAITHVYFPTTGLIGLFAATADGDAVPLAAVGRDGFVGLPVILDQATTFYQAIVQLGGEGYRVRAITFMSELRRRPELQHLALGYVHQQLSEVGQAAVCRRFHRLPARLCRGLLICARAMRSDTVQITQERLARLLGTSRTSVSSAATVLHDGGIIRHRHGRIHILNRTVLTALACPCERDDAPDRRPLPATARGALRHTAG
jgi:CRP-like cAMP-binding protein